VTVPDPTDNAEIIFGSPTPLPGLFVTLPTPNDVAAFLLWDVDEVEEHIKPHLFSVTSMARAYVRGNGFAPTEGVPGILCREDIAGVIVMATARSLCNPEQLTRIEVGSYSEVPTKFEGWTLAEQFVLNQYRRRTA